MRYDIIVVGAGPAGLTCAVYARRAGKSVLVIEKNAFGGQMTFSPKIENFPGEKSISGNALADKMVTQVLDLGADVESAQVNSVKQNDGVVTVETDVGSFEGSSLVIAAGARHRTLGIAGEEDLVGRGVYFCAVCDGAFFAGKDVALVGGGNSALQEALLLSETCRKVTIVQNLPFLTGEKLLCDAVEAKDNIEIILGYVADSFALDGGKMKSLVAVNEKGEKVSVECEGVFVAIGLVPDNSCFENLVALDERGYIKAGEDTKTSNEAVFAAGDCRTKAIRQVTTACADGSVAALAACRYVDSLR